MLMNNEQIMTQSQTNDNDVTHHHHYTSTHRNSKYRSILIITSLHQLHRTLPKLDNRPHHQQTANGTQSQDRRTVFATLGTGPENKDRVKEGGERQGGDG